MAKVLAPNKQYDGISAGVKFSNGVGECADPYLISWFRSKGYMVEEDASELQLSVPKPEVNGEVVAQEGSKFDNMTVKELKAYAEENGIDLGKVKNKADIMKIILEAEEAKEAKEQDESDQDEEKTE